MPAMPFPCAKAEAVAATRSAAERISFCLLFLFINCSCFVPSKGWMVLYRAVDTRILFFGLVDCPFVSTDLGVSVANWTCLALPRRMGVILRFHYHFFFFVIHSRGCQTPLFCQESRIPCLFAVSRSCLPYPRRQPSLLQACRSSLHRSGSPLFWKKVPSRQVPS